MREITLHTAAARSRILIGSGPLEGLLEDAALVVADSNVLARHSALFGDAEVVTLDSGEAIKSLSSAEDLYDACYEKRLDRSSLIVGVGGGTICDLTGFVASTYLRGVRLALVPTTLLAQVDASIGGKNGVNFRGVKNLIGTIVQPEICLCDPQFLTTLPEEALADGFAEVIKHAILSKGPLLKMLEERINPLSADDLEPIIYESIAVKTRIVEADERESSERRELNLGHTVGHALEIELGISHGKAVALGILAELNLSEKRGLITSAVTAKVAQLFRRYGLPTAAKYSPEKVLALMKKDKKRYGSVYKMALVAEMGRAELTDVTEAELAEILG